MRINKRKSRKIAEGLLAGFPLVNNYRYLGTVIPNHLSMRNHLEAMNNKVNYLIRKLTPFRINASAKFNNNMFKILIVPQYRLIGALWEIISAAERARVETSLRVRFKQFMLLPKSTPNDVVHMMTGSMENLVRKMG